MQYGHLRRYGRTDSQLFHNQLRGLHIAVNQRYIGAQMLVKGFVGAVYHRLIGGLFHAAMGIVARFEDQRLPGSIHHQAGHAGKYQANGFL